MRDEEDDDGLTPDPGDPDDPDGEVFGPWDGEEDDDVGYAISRRLDAVDREISRPRPPGRGTGGGEAERPAAPDEEIADLIRYLDTVEGPYSETAARMLISDGISLPPASSLDDGAELSEKLWEVIRGLARRRIFLVCTDHLSDRELYTVLWEENLNAPTCDISGFPDAACTIDLIGSGNEEDTELWLRFYAGDEDREHWKTEFPEDALPPKSSPPYDRDRNLPKR